LYEIYAEIQINLRNLQGQIQLRDDKRG